MVSSNKSQQTFSVNGQIIYIVGFEGHPVPVPTNHLCHCHIKAAIYNIQVNGCGCVPIKWYLQTHTKGWIQPVASSTGLIPILPLAMMFVV